MKQMIVLGAGGFIGSHLVKRLKQEGHWIRGVDLKYPEFSETLADDFIIGDLRNPVFCQQVIDKKFDEVFQLAADMGGAGYVFTGNNDANIMHNSAMINLNILDVCYKRNIKCIFFSSSACIYPEYNQLDPNNPKCSEDSAYPAQPDSIYGLEKLFSENLYLSYYRNYKMKVRIARFHNIFGIEGCWCGGREKAPSALCRKIAEAQNNSEIELWGDGEATRSFCYIDDCIEGTIRLMSSDYHNPINIGSEEMVTINELARKIIKISGKNLGIKHIYDPHNCPQGVRARNSDNRLIRKVLNWSPSISLDYGLEKTYKWVENRVKGVKND